MVEKIINKKGQVGESITWIIATIVLIVVLLIFIYASLALSKTKAFKLNMDEEAGNSVDWIDSKTDMAYSINSNNKIRIQNWISKRSENG